jgi:hypothetical protein
MVEHFGSWCCWFLEDSVNTGCYLYSWKSNFYHSSKIWVPILRILFKQQCLISKWSVGSRLLSSGMWYHTVWYTGSNILEQPAACIFRVVKQLKIIGSSEILVPIYQSTRYHIQQACTLDIHCSENLISHAMLDVLNIYFQDPVLFN